MGTVSAQNYVWNPGQICFMPNSRGHSWEIGRGLEVLRALSLGTSANSWKIPKPPSQEASNKQRLLMTLIIWGVNSRHSFGIFFFANSGYFSAALDEQLSIDKYSFATFLAAYFQMFNTYTHGGKAFLCCFQIWNCSHKVDAGWSPIALFFPWTNKGSRPFHIFWESWHFQVCPNRPDHHIKDSFKAN